VQIEHLRRLWEVAVDVTGNPAVGLITAARSGPIGLDVIDYVMMSSETLGSALQQAIRYARIVDDATVLQLHQHPQGLRVVFEFLVTGRPVPCQSVEFTMVSSLNFYRWMTRTALRPLQIEFMHAPAVERRLYEQLLDCPVRFAAERNGIILSRDDLALPLFTHNPQLAELHGRYAAEQIAEMANNSIAARVRRLLVLALPGGEPTREQIAAALCLSGSTLHRRLLREGCSFQGLLDETRRTLAECYLGNEKVPLCEATRLLGFNEQSSLSRACQRWFHQSPHEYRYQLAQTSRSVQMPLADVQDD
jgi:AraC-like DNA-binding protein